MEGALQHLALSQREAAFTSHKGGLRGHKSFVTSESSSMM